MKIKRIALIEPKSRRKVSFYSLFNMPRGIVLLAAILEKLGYKVDCYVECLQGYDIAKIAKEGYDLVGFSAITCTINPTCAQVQKLRRAGYGGPVVVGGPHPTACPEETLRLSGADVVVRHEGDKTFPNLIGVLEAANDLDHADLKSVRGISYWEKHNIAHNPDEVLLTCDELSALPIPAFGNVRGYKRMKHVPMSFSRSCPYAISDEACEYCAVGAMFGNYRFCSLESRRRQLKELRDQYPELWELPIFVTDDNVLGHRIIGRDMLEMMIADDLVPPKRWTCQMRVDEAKPEISELIARAGGGYVCLGIEAVDPKALDLIHKRITVDEIETGLGNLHRAGIQTVAMTIAGLDTDTFWSVFRGIRRLRDLGISHLQVLAIVPLPGTKMTHGFVRNGRCFSRNHDLYDGLSPLIRPAKMTKLGVWMAVWIAGYLWFYVLNTHALKLMARNAPQYCKMFWLIGLQSVRGFFQAVRDRLVPPR